MSSVHIPKLDSAKAVLPLINIEGYHISGKQTTIFYHIGEKNLNPVPTRHPSRHHSLSVTAAKSSKGLSYMLIPFFETTDVPVDWRSNQDHAKKMGERRKNACERIKQLPEWDACLRRLRAQVREITSGSFKQDRHNRRREAAKEAVKEAARACLTKYYIRFDEIVELAEEAVKELQVEDVMER